jgi:hypothetical protein
MCFIFRIYECNRKSYDVDDDYKRGSRKIKLIPEKCGVITNDVSDYINL